VIAAVNGFALGGACELALACHIRVASTRARFGLPEVGLGIIPGYGGTVRLARLIGLGRAVELTLTGNQVKADEAERMGLVTHVVEPDG
jgi:enoyl-CoA hydratase